MLIVGIRRGLTGTLALSVLSSLAFAGDAATSDKGKQVDRLEALLQAQQQQISQLEKQVSAFSTQDQELQRVDAMKQQIREVLSEREFRESLMPSVTQAGYDNGFYIGSSSGDFFLRINGRVQFRFTHAGIQSRNHYLRPRLQRDDRTGFDVQRLRITFSGHTYSKDLTYHIQLRSEAPEAYNTVAHYAWANYRFSDEFQVKAGIFRLASTREQTTSSANLQFVDRSMTDAVFGLGIGLGVRIWGQLFDKTVDYYFDVVNSLNSPGNRTITPDPAEHDNNPAIVLRLVCHALGEEYGEDFEHQADLEFHQSPAWDFGFHYAFNEDDGDLRTTRIPFPANRRFLGSTGGFGLTTTNGLQINQFGLDTAFKYMGFSATGQYVLRIVDPRNANSRPFTPWSRLTGDGSTTVQHGGLVQVGYFLPIPGHENQFEAVARVDGISALANDQEGSWEYAAGINYYIKGDKVKLQADVAKIFEAPISSSASTLPNVNDDILMFRVQLQVSF